MIKSLFNSTFGHYPQDWKNGLIKPIFKNGCKTEPKNYRGITLTCCIGKFFNQILCPRLTGVFEKYHIFPDNLMGFRPSMRTSNNIFILKSLIEKTLNKKEKLYCCFVDISKAFDRTWQKGLMHKLKHYDRVNGEMLSANENLYKNTNARILLGGSFSNEFEINMGVKQGDPLSSLLFNVDMCDLCTQLNQNKDKDPPHITDKKVSSLFWAEDIVLTSKSKNRTMEKYRNSAKVL